MDTLEHLSRRLTAFEDLSGIVRTMKALAAVSIRQYEEAARSLAVYYRTVELGLNAVLRSMPPAPERRPPAAVTAVVLGSDHGLCGRFNEEMADYARARLREAAADDAPRVVAAGARVAALLEDAGIAPKKTLRVPASAVRITSTVREILHEIDAWEAETGGQRFYLLHNRAVPGGRFHPTGVQLLPVDLRRFRRLEERRWPSRSLPAYTMDRERLFASLLRQYFFVSIFRACAESLVAENAARLTAMQAAERSLADRNEELVAEFRRRRQDAITAELLDVVAAYEALR